jgi:hypothetical protein
MRVVQLLRPFMLDTPTHVRDGCIFEEEENPVQMAL